jgi:hypothetical protein
MKDQRISTASAQHVKTFTRMKRFKVFAAFAVLFVMYTILFGADAGDNTFLVVGGFLGGISSVSPHE